MNESVDATISTPTLAEQLQTILRDAAVPLTMKELKKALDPLYPKGTKKDPKLAKPTEEDIQSELDTALNAKTIYVHPPLKKDARYATFPPPPPFDEQILTLCSAKKTFDEIVAGMEPPTKAPAVKKLLKQLTDEGKLHVHGKGKDVVYATFAPEAFDVQVHKLFGASDKKTLADVQTSLPHLTPAAVNKALKQLVTEGKLFAHGKGEQLTYATFASIALDEQILRLFGAADKKSAADILGELADSPSTKVVTPALKKLVKEGKLFVHGKGDQVQYATFVPPPPPPPPWNETKPFASAFKGLLKAAHKVLDSGELSHEELLTTLKAKLSDPRGESKKKREPSKPTAEKETNDEAPPPIKNLRAALKEAYDHLCLFVEFRDKLVELPRLFHETLKHYPGLTTLAFHHELWELNSERVLELHVLNEVHTAKEPHLAINRDDRLYYYARWK